MRGRRGFTLAEALIAAVLLGFALMTGLGLVIWADRIEERAAHRVAAAELAASVAERVRASPYSLLASGELDLTGEILAPLPSPRVELAVDEDAELHLKHVVIAVSWAGRDPGALRMPMVVGAAELYRR